MNTSFFINIETPTGSQIINLAQVVRVTDDPKYQMFSIVTTSGTVTVGDPAAITQLRNIFAGLTVHDVLLSTTIDT